MPRRNSCSEKMQKWFDAEQVNWKATGNVVELNRSDSWLQWFHDYESHMFTMTHKILYKLRQRSWQRWKPGRSNRQTSRCLMVDARCELHACRLKQAEDQLKMSNVAKEDKDWAADGVTFLYIFDLPWSLKYLRIFLAAHHPAFWHRRTILSIFAPWHPETSESEGLGSPN